MVSISAFVSGSTLRLIGSLSLTIVAVALVAPPTALAVDAPSDPKTQLELEKLRQEIRQIEIENRDAEGLAATASRWAPFITVVGGLITVVGGLIAVLLGIRKELREQRAQRVAERDLRQKELDHRVAQAKLEKKQHEDELEQRRVEAQREQKQREDELKQRRADAQRRFDELFSQAVANLGSSKESVQLSAVVVFDSLLQNEEGQFGEQIYSIVCLNLATDHSPLVNRFLVRTFSKAVRIRLAAPPEDEEQEPLDLANCKMPRIDLHGLSLKEADVAFASLRDAKLMNADMFKLKGYEVDMERARLHGANLQEARMHGAQCAKAQFHDATLVSAEFRPTKEKRANFAGAEFFGARMQGAHFEGADLTGAAFDDANIADAYFTGATLDNDALHSLLTTRIVNDVPSWQKAQFDKSVRAQLDLLWAGHRAPRRRRRVRVAPSANQPVVDLSS